jgi:hypothetical protein
VEFRTLALLWVQQSLEVFAPQGPAAPPPYPIAQNIARKSLFMNILDLKSFDLNILRLPITLPRPQPKRNQEFSK